MGGGAERGGRLWAACLLGAVLLGGAALSAPVGAAAYLLSALGIGLLLGLSPALGFCVGLAGLLSLSFLLGVTGAIANGAGQWVALGVLAPGVVAGLLWALERPRPNLSAVRLSRSQGVALAAGVAALVVGVLAASTAPGILWDSEFGGYDALSYHLELPAEWLRSASTMPVEHNVYSYLPGYLEHAANHLHTAMGLRGEPLALTDGIEAMQWLAFGLLIASAVLAGVAAKELAPGANGLVAGVVLVATPWAVVVGTLAYNETGVVALGLGAVIACRRVENAWLRGLCVGGLVGVACGVKPTALFMLAPALGVLMLGLAPRKEWPKLVAGACAAGLVAILPWLIRNWVAAGNPVFPAAAGQFGTGHWDTEQAARFAASHTFDGSFMDRLRLMVLPDPSDPAGTRHRGLLHPQWLALFPAAVVAMGIGLARRDTRRVSALLGIGLGLQILAWLLLTHIQSRFLLPCLVLAAPMIEIACEKGWRAWAGAVVCVVQAGALVLLLSGQSRAGYLGLDPLAMTVARGPGELTETEIDEAPTADFAAGLIARAPGTRLCLIGSATPLYYAADVVYATTWDRHPFAAAVREHPGDPGAWSAALADLGVTHVMIDLGELNRLERSGFLDPILRRGPGDPGAVVRWLEAGRGLRVVKTWDNRFVLVELTGS